MSDQPTRSHRAHTPTAETASGPRVASDPMVTDGEATHAVVLPVKPPAVGKSRLRGLGEQTRRDLAAAFALDTAAAALESRHVGAVLVITDDAFFSGELAALGCAAIPDGVSGDLNASLAQGAAEAARRWPHWSPVALCADLPALRPADLDLALAGAGPSAAYVADAEGLGTTLFTAPLDRFVPRFGAGSAAAHQRAGARPIPGELASLRRDVDDLDALRAAAPLGLGPRTLLAALRAGLVLG
ncbi:2-phospho-L-lactate guanylyltransferase [Nocardioides insulae]|uniref:2-phospho-L-lactate guanylyltransferase n=1 Tax=Nocardioides insulae TaxID=394734 RepID=UPI000401F08A|nr:2-phospho-L-lactate guanylyltransferase [Nocardioides insulae]